MAKEVRTRLLVGIMSHCGRDSNERRRAMRSMLHQSSDPAAGIVVRFVLARNTTRQCDDADAADTLRFDVARDDRNLGTFLLTTAFFRYAVKLLPRPQYIARADDDTFFQPQAVLSDLAEFNATRRLVYGPFGEWYSWHPTSMQPGCFGWSPVRFYNAQLFARLWLGLRLAPYGREYEYTWPDGLAYPIRSVDQSKTAPEMGVPRVIRSALRGCLPELGMVGPFPFAKGPFVAFSSDLAVEMVRWPQFDDDEQYALGERERAPLLFSPTSKSKARHPTASCVTRHTRSLVSLLLRCAPLVLLLLSTSYHPIIFLRLRSIHVPRLSALT